MARVPVLIFETDSASSDLFDFALTRQGIPHFSCLVPLKRGESPPAEYFRKVLEKHRPELLITSWREIGPVVKFAEQAMAEPRPVEKWIVSSYSMQTLEDHRAIGWADEIYRKPISPLELVSEIEQRLQRISLESLAHPTIY